MSLWDELLDVGFEAAFRLLGCAAVILLFLTAFAIFGGLVAGAVAAFQYLT